MRTKTENGGGWGRVGGFCGPATIKQALVGKMEVKQDADNTSAKASLLKVDLLFSAHS